MGKKKAIANHYYHIANSPKAKAKAEAKAKEEAKAEAKPLGHAAKAREALAAVKYKFDAAVAAAKAKAKPLGHAPKARDAVAEAKAKEVTAKPPGRTTGSIARPSDTMVHDQAIRTGLPVSEIQRIHTLSIPMINA